jgi:hypothetical protein
MKLTEATLLTKLWPVGGSLLNIECIFNAGISEMRASKEKSRGVDTLEVYFGSLENVLGLHRWSSLWGGRVAVMLL